MRKKKLHGSKLWKENDKFLTQSLAQKIVFL